MQIWRCCSVSLFNGISNILGWFNAKAILVEEELLFKPELSGDKNVHTFLKSVCPKVNEMAWLEFELIYYDVTVQLISHYATGILTS